MLGIPGAGQNIKVIIKIPMHIEGPGSAVEALLDHELGPPGVVVSADHDDTFPQRVVCSQTPESDGHLAEDVNEEVA